jgi:hypothetical protein
MGGSTRFAFVLFTLAAIPPGLASAQPDTAAIQAPREMAALRARISRLPAAEVDTSRVITTLETDQPPTVAPEASPTAPQESAAILRPQIDEVRVPQRELRLKDVLYVPLGAADEAKTKLAVAQQVQQQAGGTVAVFEGAIRTLSKESAELALKAVVLAGSPLRYRPDLKRFEGTLNVGVVEIGGRTARQLSEPIIFQVIGAVTATPALARAESTAPPYQTITIASNSAEPVDVQVVSNVTPEGVKLTLPVQPALFVRVTPPRIQGWGLETADVLVQSRALAPTGNRQVQFSTDGGGIVTPTELTLNATGTGTASIRSVSTGPTVVTVSGPGFSDEASAPVEFVFPMRFIIAAILGGLAGGLLRIGVPRRGSGKRALANLGLGVICGAIVFALYALGVNVIGFQLPRLAGEVLVFVVAALGALGGVGLLTPKKP